MEINGIFITSLCSHLRFKTVSACVSSVFPSTLNSGENYKQSLKINANCFSITQNRGENLTTSEGLILRQLREEDSSCFQSLHVNHLCRCLPSLPLPGAQLRGLWALGWQEIGGPPCCQLCLPSTLPPGVRRGAAEAR